MTTSPMVSLPRPVARCRKCGSSTTQAERINTTCGHRVATGFCRGILRSALRPGDWIECPTCEPGAHASSHASNPCPGCGGAGWIFAGGSGAPAAAAAGPSVRSELLLHAEGLRGLAGRARALAREVSDEADHGRLLRHAVELDEHARRLEIEIVH